MDTNYLRRMFDVPRWVIEAAVAPRIRGMSDDPKQIRDDFADAVNMTAGELDDWLATGESRSVGQKNDGGESTGHASGRRIAELLRTRKDDLTDDDLAHMRKVVAYVKRHAKQR